MADMEMGLHIASKQNFHHLIIEGDSKFLIQGLRKVITGMKSDRVSRHWKLQAGYENLAILSRSFSTILCVHVRRNANKLADRLANKGVTMTNRDLDMAWRDLPQGKLHQNCISIEYEDSNPHVQTFNYTKQKD
jgi:ribonuclease HI